MSKEVAQQCMPQQQHKERYVLFFRQPSTMETNYHRHSIFLGNQRVAVGHVVVQLCIKWNKYEEDNKDKIIHLFWDELCRTRNSYVGSLNPQYFGT